MTDRSMLKEPIKKEEDCGKDAKTESRIY